ncbi:MAG: hypothetical protein GEV07_15250 [Streptosporangiales bacterium]|nr:hypothetical protein [Streptosporangiales bacterium]
MTRRLVSAVAAALAAMGGLWLVLAPFALGSQPKGADWTDQTWTDVSTGAGLAFVGLVGLLASATALRQHLLDRGLVTPRPRHAPVPQPAPATEPAGGADTELKALVGPLVAALTQDLERDRRDGHQQLTGQYRREQPL